ncbi:MAG: ABC-2 type transport system ATP-binding protein [Candidatus Promineifilaceae bacterium]|jgi:ABC-2 type transport system ATP-binding protein
MIEIDHLTKFYGDKCAVNDLSLEVPAGEVFCFLGPNGAGKTSTIKIMTGLLRATSGAVRIGGHDIQADAQAAKRLIGYIPDMPYVYERFTSSEFFDFSGDIYNIARRDVAQRKEEYFDLFGLNEHRDVLVKELSHGLRQRLIYASTFLHEPKVLFVDEPLIGLDPHTIRLIKDLLKARAAAGMTVFMTTHILTLAEDIGDRIGIIMHGRLCALGDLQSLLREQEEENLEDMFLKMTHSDFVKEGN